MNTTSMPNAALVSPDSTPTAASGDALLLDLDPAFTRDAVGRREFAFRHHVAKHPLLGLEALAELADRVPPAAVERHAASQPLLVPGGAEDFPGSASETVRNIERDRHWLVLKNVEQIPEYSRLLDDILDEAAPLLPRREEGMGRREAYLFMSAPRAVTPVHFDPEHNFLLQIRGSKEVCVGRFADRDSRLAELDRYYNGGHRNLVAIPSRSSVFPLTAGDGVYLYPWAPHWVHNGPEVSVSLSITFRSRRSERFEFASLFNHRLRRYGMHPRPAGESDLRDRGKAAAVSLSGWLHRHGRRQRGDFDFSG
ncbi:MAG TPA: hypothetical protein VFX38_03265, partial [Gammaproteobacteria bacterium]|nr:hypothetical protein [Gammaproteobacteria bacterium]